MARIRSIKPEFWIDEKIVELSAFARLLFIGMWNFTDDQGYIEYKPKRLKMQIFPADSIDVEPLLGELLDQGVVKPYDSPIGPVLHIVNWVRHQRVEKPAKPRFDPAELRPFQPPPVPPLPTGTIPGGLPEAAPSDPWSVAVPKQPPATNGHVERPDDHPEPAQLGIRGTLPEASPTPPESSPAEWSGREGKGEEGKGKKLLVLAVGDHLAVPSQRPAPPAKPRRSSSRPPDAAATLAAIPRYRAIAGTKFWYALVALTQDAVADGYGPDAIQRYAHMVIAEGTFRDDQHVPELREALRRMRRDNDLGDACHAHGLPECRHCTVVEDRPWTADDDAQLARALAFLQPTAERSAA